MFQKLERNELICRGCGSSTSNFIIIDSNTVKCPYCDRVYSINETSGINDDNSIREKARIFAEEQHEYEQWLKREEEEREFYEMCNKAKLDKKAYIKGVLITLLVGFISMFIIASVFGGYKLCGLFIITDIVLALRKLINLRKQYGDSLDICRAYCLK